MPTGKLSEQQITAIEEALGVGASPTKPTTRRKNQAHNEPQKRPFQFSKVLVVIATIVYIAGLIFYAISWCVLKDAPPEFLMYSTGMYGVSVGAYFAKAGYENRAKIMKNPEYDG